MRWASWGLILVITALAVVWLGLLWRMFTLRHDFEIAARSPALACLTSFTSLVLAMSVLLYWLLLTMDKTFPCWAVFWVSCSTYPLAIFPYFIRVLRLVVAYNKTYRGKYARFVKWKIMFGCWVAATVLYTVRSAMFFGRRPEHFSSDTRDCYYWDDTVVLAFMIMAGGVPMLLLATKLRSVNDSFKIREEIERVVGICFICAGTVAVIHVVVTFKIVRDSRRLHVVAETMVFLWATNVGFWGLLVPLVSYLKRNRYRVDKALVVPVEDNKPTYEMDGVLALASKGGDVCKRFEHFCRENLCMESWYFVVDAVLYEMAPTNDPDQRYDAFLRILDQYLLPTSPHEINISSAMRKRVASFKTRKTFDSLDDDARRCILKELLAEIVLVLEQNLLGKFRTRAMREAETQLAEDGKGDTELIDLMRTSYRRDSWGV